MGRMELCPYVDADTRRNMMDDFVVDGVSRHSS